MTAVEVLREIAPSARIAPGVRIGPYCVIGPSVSIGPDTLCQRRVSVEGFTTIGSGNVIGEGCVFGADPQDLKYRGSRTAIVIGHRNLFGRLVTVHVGTEDGGGLTRIGNDNRLMLGCHVAHDCYIDDGATIGRKVLLAGHVHVQSGAVIGDLAGAHHFTTIGRYAYVGPRTPVRRDVPPFMTFASEDCRSPSMRGLHEAGLRSAGLTDQEGRELRRALHELFDDESALQTKIEQLVNMGVEGEVAALCEFCRRSLQGVYGRYRELFRGQVPPEAHPYYPVAPADGGRRPLG